MSWKAVPRSCAFDEACPRPGARPRLRSSSSITSLPELAEEEEPPEEEVPTETRHQMRPRTTSCPPAWAAYRRASGEPLSRRISPSSPLAAAAASSRRGSDSSRRGSDAHVASPSAFGRSASLDHSASTPPRPTPAISVTDELNKPVDVPDDREDH
eukprot:m.294740 g.294740  ORF g.294740 m.294740 type:complete len:156 (+) comp13049_c0_seq1:413-880(+)